MVGNWCSDARRVSACRATRTAPSASRQHRPGVLDTLACLGDPHTGGDERSLGVAHRRSVGDDVELGPDGSLTGVESGHSPIMMGQAGVDGDDGRGQLGQAGLAAPFLRGRPEQLGGT